MDEQSPKTRFSNFFVTINTNFRPRNSAEATQVGHELFAAFRTMLTPVGFRYITVIMNKDHTFDNNILEFDVPYWATELGKDPRGARVHLHAFIKVTHTSFIRLSPNRIKHWVRPPSEHDKNPEMAAVGAELRKERSAESLALADDPRIKCLKLDIKHVPATEEMIQRYIKKGVHVNSE